MKHPVAILAVLIATSVPVAAQDDDGTSLMEEGMMQFLEGLMKEMEPAFEGMNDLLNEMGPAMTELFSQIEDWSAYHPPEILDNGDIIIRRKEDRPVTPEPSPVPADPPQIDL